MSQNKVLATASSLFARRGIDGVSIAEIAAAAEMSKANVLHHFRTKDRLYRACLTAVGERLEAVIAAAAVRIDAGDVDPMVALRTELERWADDHPDDVRLMAFGLLRLRERPGPWVLENAIVALMRTARLADDEAVEAMVDLMGPVTYRVMAAPLESAVMATARRVRSETAAVR